MTGRGAASPTSPRNVDARARAADAVARRRRGETYDAIATALGWSDRSGPRKAVAALLEELGHDDAAALRDEQAERLDELLSVLLPTALRGDLHAVDRVLRVFERQARLLGLDGLAEHGPGGSTHNDAHASTGMTGRPTLRDLLGGDEVLARRLARQLHESGAFQTLTEARTRATAPPDPEEAG